MSRVLLVLMMKPGSKLLLWLSSYINLATEQKLVRWNYGVVCRM